MINIFAYTPTIVIARKTVSFLDIGIHEFNTLRIVKIGDPFESYDPFNEDLNSITGFEEGEAYFFFASQNIDLEGIADNTVPEGHVPQPGINVHGGKAFAGIAIQSGDFSTAGITASNLYIIYKIGNPYESYMPSEDFSAIVGFEEGQAYYGVALQDMDLSAWLVPPIIITSDVETPTDAYKYYGTKATSEKGYYDVPTRFFPDFTSFPTTGLSDVVYVDRTGLGSYIYEGGIYQQISSGGPDTNFATTDLTATGNRTHDFATYSLEIGNVGFFNVYSTLVADKISEYYIDNNDCYLRTTNLTKSIKISTSTGSSLFGQMNFVDTGVVNSLIGFGVKEGFVFFTGEAMKSGGTSPAQSGTKHMVTVDTLGNIGHEVIPVGSSYTLPIASASVLGGIKVGTGLSINASTGVLSADLTGISTTWSGFFGGTSTSTGNQTVPYNGSVQWLFTGGVAATYTLPDPAAVNAGNRAYFVRNDGTANLTLTTVAGTNVFRDTSDVATIVLAPGDKALFMSGFNIWRVYRFAGSSISTLGAIGNSPNVNGATITGNQLILQPANETHGGVVSNTTQNFTGTKTFKSSVVFESSMYLGNETFTTTGTISSARTFVILNSATNATITLPNPGSGKWLTIRNHNAGTWTITPYADPNWKIYDQAGNILTTIEPYTTYTGMAGGSHWYFTKIGSAASGSGSGGYDIRSFDGTLTSNRVFSQGDYSFTIATGGNDFLLTNLYENETGYLLSYDPVWGNVMYVETPPAFNPNSNITFTGDNTFNTGTNTFNSMLKSYGGFYLHDYSLVFTNGISATNLSPSSYANTSFYLPTRVDGDPASTLATLELQTPANSSGSGYNTGTFIADDNYLYFKTSTGALKRIAWTAF